MDPEAIDGTIGKARLEEDKTVIVALFVSTAMLLLVVALLRLLWPMQYARYVLRLVDEQARTEWLERSSKTGAIVALIILAFMLLDLLFGKSW